MKVALLTIHRANNYGALLQAYATQQAFSKFTEIEIIDYENKKLSRSLNYIRFEPNIHGLKMLIHDILRLNTRPQAIKRIKLFIKDKYTTTNKVKPNGLKRFLVKNTYSAVICGSDQIWNPDITGNNGAMDKNYFLGFADSSLAKISYASSKGNYQYNYNESLDVKNLLQEYTNISVRESDLKKYLSTKLDINATHVLDPTLLLTRKEWIKLIPTSSSAPKYDYLLVYSVPKSPLLLKAASILAEKFNLPIVSIDQNFFPSLKNAKNINNAGPIEFLDLFINASFIVTDSFHGSCFSINFKKQFCPISSGIRSNRMKSLLSSLNIEHMIVENESQLGSVSREVDFSEAYKKLERLQSDSYDFIKQSLDTI